MNLSQIAGYHIGCIDATSETGHRVAVFFDKDRTATDALIRAAWKWRKAEWITFRELIAFAKVAEGQGR